MPFEYPRNGGLADCGGLADMLASVAPLAGYFAEQHTKLLGGGAVLLGVIHSKPYIMNCSPVNAGSLWSENRVTVVPIVM